MPDIPGWSSAAVYAALVVGYTVVDRVIFARTGAPNTRERHEWTYWTVIVPYGACFAVPVFELVTHVARPGVAGMLLGSILVTAAAALRWLGVRELGKNFSASVETHEDHALIDTGVFSAIRHPLYLGLAMLYVGLPLAAGARYAWIATVLGLVGLGLRIDAEERWLVRDLPGYDAYMRRTKRLIPGIW